MSTRVVHVNDRVEGAIYIGRANGRRRLARSPWANPWAIRGDPRIPERRDYVIDLYRVGLTTGGRAQLADLPLLRGKALSCWCRHDGEPRTAATACHGDVLVELLERYTDDELRAMGGAS